MKEKNNLTPEELLKWRKKQGLSQIKSGKTLGVTTITVYRWEKAMREIPSFLHSALKFLELKGSEPETKNKRRRKTIKTLMLYILPLAPPGGLAGQNCI
ncbi:MAG: helix-turn-helix transcriptional regulator [Deltaproteobacteria bacterium]|nr:helix-turn-helix transcriptional regulator [Deltaproteobacteria bacterium]